MVGENVDGSRGMPPANSAAGRFLRGSSDGGKKALCVATVQVWLHRTLPIACPEWRKAGALQLLTKILTGDTLTEPRQS
jgi:hypothetical protein